MMHLEQSAEAKADAAALRGMFSIVWKRSAYGHYTAQVRATMPEGWTEDRLRCALIDAVDGGWSPFGGSCHPIGRPVEVNLYLVTVFTD